MERSYDDNPHRMLLLHSPFPQFFIRRFSLQLPQPRGRGGASRRSCQPGGQSFGCWFQGFFRGLLAGPSHEVVVALLAARDIRSTLRSNLTHLQNVTGLDPWTEGKSRLKGATQHGRRFLNLISCGRSYYRSRSPRTRRCTTRQSWSRRKGSGCRLS